LGLLGPASYAWGGHAELGVFDYDSRTAHKLVGPEILEPDNREVCSEQGLHVVGQAYAEMFNLRHEETCSDSLLVLERPEEPVGVCKFSGLDDMGVGFLDQGGESGDSVLVSLDLTSYRMNPRAERSVDRNLRAFTGRIKKRFGIYLSRSARYTRMMRSILREEGIPEDMVYLAMIESGFNTHAYSPARASGPWQFMKHTGKRFGLRLNRWVDERRDPVKSTRAAGRYLRYLHNMFDSWSLAMAAYNAGEGRIRGALRKSSSRDYWSLMGTRHIKPETKNYVPKFIAARLIAVAPEKYGFTDINYYDDFVFDEVELKKQMKLSDAASFAGTTIKAIKELNPELRRDRTPPVKSYRLRVPRGAKELFVANALRRAGEHSVAAKTYTVESGDSIGSISEKTGVPGEIIISYNRLEGLSPLETGLTLVLPIIN
jgi:membrane-bound lytic murein transglycosylase D